MLSIAASIYMLLLPQPEEFKGFPGDQHPDGIGQNNSAGYVQVLGDFHSVGTILLAISKTRGSEANRLR